MTVPQHFMLRLRTHLPDSFSVPLKAIGKIEEQDATAAVPGPAADSIRKS